jgi:hypothetical protein
VPDNYLIVPMHLDAMVLNEHATAATPFLRFQVNYGELSNFKDPETPFPGGSDVPPKAGTYLHWTLPKALRHGVHQKDGTTDFPLIPNRWLVVRTQGGVEPKKAIKAWIVMSDFLGTNPSEGTSNFIDPNHGGNGVPSPYKIGQAFPFPADLTSLPDQKTPLFLKAMGPGSATFSSYEPGLTNILAFVDDMTDNGARPIESGTFTYQVIGWYSDTSKDPLQLAKWTASDKNEQVFTSLNSDWPYGAGFDWVVYIKSDSDIPRQMLVHGLVSGVSWVTNSPNLPAPGYPTDIPNTVQVAVGHTAVDALAALASFKAANPAEGATEAALLEAFQYQCLELFDQPGSSEALDMVIRQHWYGATNGGTVWTIVAAERTGDTGLPAQPAPPITGPQAAALAALNTKQAELDRQQRILQSMQWNLFSLWWKNQWQNNNNPPLEQQYQQWLQNQLPLQLGSGSVCQDPRGTDPSKEDWYLCKVKAQANRVSQLTAEREDLKSKIPLPGTPAVQQLKAGTLPQYFHPVDPVVVISGLGRSTNFDPVDGLVCRVTAQTISQLTVNNTTYTTVAGPGTNIQPKIPLLNDPHNLLPRGVQDLNTEVFFLSPALFAQNILNDPQQTQVVKDAIGKLGDPPAAAQFPPPSFAIPEWVQPWIPLLLDWEVTVFREPAYTAPTNLSSPVNQPTCTFNQQNWQFDGTKYTWVGPTTATGTNFDEALLQMQFQGRTFITPYPVFTLAKQLDQYVKKHSLRDPSLEALLQDLDQYVHSIQDLDILSQRLSGMMAQMIQRYYAMSATPWSDNAGNIDIKSQLGDSRHGYPHPYPDKTFFGHDTSAIWDFAPLAGTFFVINRLMVIDSYGRTIDVTQANGSGWPHTTPPPAEDYFYPIAAGEMASPTLQKPNGKPSKDATERMLQLPPRIIQDSRLDFHFTSNDGQNADIDSTAEANPICGWVVPNHIDGSLALYAPDGTAWGELFLALAGGNSRPHWQPDPSNPAAPPSIERIPNAYVKGILQALDQLTDNGAAFSGFFQVIDETLWTINPRGQTQDQDLSVFVGRPLAIVRAELSLKLNGLPYYNQDWWNTFVFPDPLDDDTGPVPIGALDGGLGNFLWPIRLGSQVLRDDGLIGYYADDPDPAKLANSFQVFNSVVLPKGIETSYLRQIGPVGQPLPGNYVSLRFIDDIVAQPDPGKHQVCRITMLVDPRGSVHAFSGLLPVVSRSVPSTLVKPALVKMAYLFRVGPFLTSPDKVRIPRPSAHKGTWAWFDKVIDTTTGFEQADGRVSFPSTPPLVKEGWLKFTPNPPTSRPDES